MYQQILKQKIDLKLYNPLKKETSEKIKQINRLDYIYGAMTLDGTEFSRQQIEGMIEGEMPRTASLKECIFVKNYVMALDLIRDSLELKNNLDKTLLLRLHSTLTGQVSRFRNSNALVSEFKYVPPHHSEIESNLSRLLQGVYKKAPNEIQGATRIHCGMMEIQPFGEYNGVMARLAMNYYLEEKGFQPVALGYNRDEYVKTMTECLKDKDDAIFFWGLERAEFNKQELVLQVIESEEEE